MILIYVQHLLGSGHLQRVRLISEELIHQGCEVTIVTGGMPSRILDFPGVELVQLEPVRSDGVSFSRLIDVNDNQADDALYERRRKQLAKIYEQLKPRVLLIESYPFGRRAFRLELLDLLAKAERDKPRVFVACSIRDVLQQRKLKRQVESCDIANRFFNAVLVHGDKSFIDLRESFDCEGKISHLLTYTGYVAAAPVPRLLDHITNGGEIIVAAGGGAAGQRVYQLALEAAASGRINRSWRILVGSGISDQEFQVYQDKATHNVVVERNRDDYRELLAECSLCICQAGYNSVLDLLVTAAPALLVPFEGEGETEQLTRARRLVELKRVRMIREEQLSIETLLEQIDLLLRDKPVDLPDIDLCGAQNSADYLLKKFREISV